MFMIIVARTLFGNNDENVGDAKTHRSHHPDEKQTSDFLEENETKFHLQLCDQNPTIHKKSYKKRNSF